MTDRGPWIQTFTGGAFYPFDPRPEEIHIVDIAHALSNLCRFAGHTSRFYSVAEHSVYVAEHCEREHALAGLLHDASEAYLVDIPRPIKHAIRDYAEIEAAVLAAVGKRFGVDLTPLPDNVKEADDRMLVTEQRAFMRKPPVTWTLKARPYTDVKFHTPSDPNFWKDEFLTAFRIYS